MITSIHIYIYIYICLSLSLYIYIYIERYIHMYTYNLGRRRPLRGRVHLQVGHVAEAARRIWGE